MIIGQESRLMDAAVLLNTLQRTGEAVALVGINGKNQGFCAGWLITDQLLVVPDFSIPDRNNLTEYLCYFTMQGEIITTVATATRIPSRELSADEQKKPLLLRFAGPVTSPTLKLGAQTVRENDQVLIFQYPYGKTPLQMSVGHVVKTTETNFQYTADTMPGAAGAPIVSFNGAVLGMHVGSSPAQNEQTYNANEGILLSHIIRTLQETPEWPEIAAFHRLIDIKETPALSVKESAGTEDTALLQRSALRWSMNRRELTLSQQSMLEPLIIEPDNEEWIMEPKERHRIIREAGSLEALRPFRSSGSATDPMQIVINRILDGPPYAITNLPEKELIYWQKAVQWFQDIVPDLPSAPLIRQTLEKRRLRSKLTLMAGPDFKGRKEQLSQLHAWKRIKIGGPKVISGIGGAGKSALLAKFVLELPEDEVIFWLDFDRSDLAPDDAVSVLQLIREQALLQIDPFRVPKTWGNWKDDASALAQALAEAVPDTFCPIMVLDGFEVAQHAKRYQEIWDVLNIILARLPTLHVIVSGRAPVPNLLLNGRKDDHPIHLKGMDQESAREWLHENHIQDEAIVNKVLEMSRCIPLILQMAVRLINNGGEVQDLPGDLSEKMVQGYLYERILNRVIDPRLRELTKDVLVLRLLHENMLDSILKEHMPPRMSKAAVFDQLKREMGLVKDKSEPSMMLTGETNMLHVRPEVRSATLKLLALNSDERVIEIHRRAIAWYEEHGKKPEEKAELVYHCLCIGDLDNARQHWEQEHIAYLGDAKDEIPEQFEEARRWLQQQLDASVTVDGAAYAWEQDAHKRIMDLISRRHLRGIAGILAENNERSRTSPLIAYDAWVAANNGEYQRAMSLLEKHSDLNDETGRNNVFLAAAIAYRSKNTGYAKFVLEQLDKPKNEQNQRSWNIGELLLRAARIRLTVDLEDEINLFNRLHPLYRENQELEQTLRKIISCQDVMTPVFTHWLSPEQMMESVEAGPYVPSHVNKLSDFENKIRDEYKWNTRRSDEDISQLFSTLRTLLLDAYKNMYETDTTIEQIRRLTAAGRERWALATQDLYLFNALKLVTDTSSSSLREIRFVNESVYASLAAFRGQELTINLPAQKRSYYSIDDILENGIDPKYDSATLQLTAEKIQLIKALLSQAKDILYFDNKTMYTFLEAEHHNDNRMLQQIIYNLMTSSHIAGLSSIILFIISPDPFDIIYRSILKLPLTEDLSTY